MRAGLRVVGFMAAFLIGWSLSAAAGTPTLKTITVDGDMADWAEVITNPIQYTVDGASASNCSQSTDRDCPVQSNGRDLVGFCWTYDSSSVYLYIKRVGSDSNADVFFFAMDVGQNKRMDSTDYVLVVSWQGNNRSTSIVLYRYVPANPATGDALVDASGYADGYRLPGSIGAAVWSDYGKRGGSSSGSEMETYVPWSALGIAPGTPIYFHVASSNNTKINTAQDNLGGPGGGLGAFAYYSATLSAGQTRSTSPGGAVTFSHALRNTGTFNDSYTLGLVSSMGYSLALYVNGLPVSPGSSVALAAGASATIEVDVTTSASPAVAVDTTTLRATSSGDGSVLQAADKTYVGDVSLVADSAKLAAQGLSASYPHTLTNLLAADLFNFTAHDSAGFRLDLYSGVTLIATDLTGDGIWDYVAAGYDSDANGLPDLIVANGASSALVLVVTVPVGASLGTVDTATLQAAGKTNGGSASVTDTTTVRPRLSVTPSYLFSTQTNLFAGAGMSTYFAHTLVNAGPQAETFSFYAPGYQPVSTAGFAVTLYSDPNGDGNPSDGAVISDTGVVAANGGTFHFIVRVDVPSNVAPPATDSTVVTAVRCAAPGCASFDTSVKGAVTDETKVAYIVAFKDANRTIQAGAFSPCSTVYTGGFNLVPAASYALVYNNPSGSTVRTQSLTADNAGGLSDSYAFAATAPAGIWTVLLRDSAGNDLDSATFSIQRSASLAVQPSALGAPLYGGTLAAASQFSNSNSQAAYASTRVDYVVKDPAGSQYLNAGGFFAPYAAGNLTASHGPFDVNAGSASTDSFAVPSVTFPDYGIYSVCATWESSCGSSSSPADNLASSCSSLYVVSWISYADAGHTAPASTFEAPAAAYLQGQGYGNGLGYVVALYGPSGALLSTTSATSASGGLLAFSAATASLPGTGRYHAAIYLNAASAPAAYASGDPSLLASLAFDVTLSAPVLTGPVMDGATSVSGTSTAPAGSVVTLYVNGVAAGTATVQAGGGFTVTPGSAFASGDVLKASVQVGTVTSALSDPITVSPPVALLRAGVVTQLSPQSPPNSAIFYQAYPDDPALDPSLYTEQTAFASGASFPHEASDLQAGSSPLIFYELSGNSGNTLRVAKSGGKIVITY